MSLEFSHEALYDAYNQKYKRSPNRKYTLPSHELELSEGIQLLVFIHPLTFPLTPRLLS